MSVKKRSAKSGAGRRVWAKHIATVFGPAFAPGLEHRAAFLGALRGSSGIGIGGRVTSPPLPHHRTGGSRIRRFDKFVPRITTWAGRSQFGDAVRVSLLGLASVAASPRCAYPRPAEAGWPVQYPHRDPSTTDPSYRSGLRRSRDYYALC